jgi:hypothetical protein
MIKNQNKPFRENSSYIFISISHMQKKYICICAYICVFEYLPLIRWR